MAYLHCNFFSDALSLNTDINVIIPSPNSDELMNDKDSAYFVPGVKYQVLYLLHGTYGDYTDWMRLTSIEKYAQNHKLMVVMPSVGNSFYQDMYIGPKYFTFMSEELPKYIQTLFPASSRREDTFVAGLSMGGYGAAALAIRRPDLYAASGILSAGIDFSDMFAENLALENGAYPWPIKAILPPPYSYADSDLNLVPILEEHLQNGVKLPKFLITAGQEDFVYPVFRQTVDYFTAKQIDFEVEEGQHGIHDWDYWDTHIQWVLDHMGLKDATV